MARPERKFVGITEYSIDNIAGLLLFLCLTVIPAHTGASAKIIIDTDLSHYSDDHEALVMLATLHKSNQVELLGVTLVTGNDWMDQLELDTLKALERLGLAKEIPVYRGSERPLLHSQERFLQFDRELYGAIYAGAWMRERRAKSPPDGPPEGARPQSGHAVDFIIESIRNEPGEITIAALGPLTNLALAIRKAPDIVNKINRVIYMGGAFFVWGNVTTSAEFNWWFDAEAASIVLSEPVHHVIIPLDATDRILFDKTLYERFTGGKYRNHFMVTQFLVPKFGQKINANPDYKLPVWDALVAAYIAEPDLAVERQRYWISVDTNPGPHYGRSYAAPVDSNIIFMDSFQPFSSKQAEVILRLDTERFWQVYEQLLFAGENSPD